MVNTINIHELRQQEIWSAADIMALQEAAKHYPWCNAYHVLLARANSDSDSYLRDKYLRKAALYIGDRSVLFDLIHDAVREEIGSDMIAEPEVQEVNTSNEVVKPVAEEPSIEEVKQPEVEQRPKINFDEVVKYDPLKDIKVEEQPPKEEEVRIPLDHVVYDPEKELNRIIEEKESAEQGDDKDFMYWLNHVGDEAEPEKPKSEKSPDAMHDLLDQFLATKRSRPIKQREFYKAQNKAEESETDRMDVVSETLLRLYLKQGLYEKAIAGYQKLSLQNPSKSAYFAALIEEIKEKQAQNKQ